MKTNINNKVMLLLSVFIVIISSVVFLGSLADQVYLTRNGDTVTNATITITNAYDGDNALDNDNIISITSFTNVSDGTAYANYTIDLENGLLRTQDNASYKFNYTYYPDTYVQDGSSRTIMSLLPVFFALACIMVGVGFAYKSFKDFI